MGITRVGMAELCNLGLNDDSPNYWGYLGIGTGTTAFDNEQTALVTPYGDREEATVGRITTTYADDTMRLTALFEMVGDATITEVAVFNGLTGEEMLARTVLTTPRELLEGETYTLVYDIPLTAT